MTDWPPNRFSTSQQATSSDLSTTDLPVGDGHQTRIKGLLEIATGRGQSAALSIACRDTQTTLSTHNLCLQHSIITDNASLCFGFGAQSSLLYL